VISFGGIVKKKFLPANKQITRYVSYLWFSRFSSFIADGIESRLNSTLSVRIEELSAQISFLQAENVSLREAKISLGSQLKKEREKSRKIMADAEAAVRFTLAGQRLLASWCSWRCV